MKTTDPSSQEPPAGGTAAQDALDALTPAERIQLALDAGAIIGTWVWDVPADRFVADELFARSFGLDPVACQRGLTVREVMTPIHPDDRPHVEQAVQAVLARGGAYRCEYRVLRADGRHHWVAASGWVDLDASGQPLRFPGVLTDIDEQRRLEAERDAANQLLRSVIDAVPGVVYVKDREGRLLVANRATAQLVGKDPAQFLGRTDREFLTDRSQAEAVMANDRRIMESGVPEHLEEAVFPPDGTMAIWLSSKAPFRGSDGRVIGLIGVSIDITGRKGADQALRRSEAFLSGVLDALPVGLLLADAQGAIIRSNAAMRELWGALPDTNSWSEYGEWVGYWPETGRRIQADEWGLARSLRTGEVVRSELVEGQRFSDGARRLFLNNAAPVYAASGELLGGVAVAVDVTQRIAIERALAARERELKTLADNIPDVVSRFDAQLRHVFVNSAIERVTGCPASQFLGRTARELGIAAELCTTWDGALVEVFATGRACTREFGFETPEGRREFFVRYTPEPGPGGTVQHVLAVATDVTARKQAEEALQQESRRKDEFLYTLAHELRNPLAPIGTSIELLKRIPAGAGNGVRALEIIERQFRHIVRLIDDLLDVARIGKGKIGLNLARVSLRDAIEEAVQSSRGAIDSFGHALEMELPREPLPVQADPTRLMQILANLLTNAAKYTPPGGRLRVAARREGAEALVQVRDNGAGIPPQMLGRIFDLFTQVPEHQDRWGGGLGIGLSLVRRLVELHGGRIQAESDGLGHGSTFSVWLPLLAA